MTEQAPRKGQKVWLVGMDRTGLYEVVLGTYVGARDGGRTPGPAPGRGAPARAVQRVRVAGPGRMSAGWTSSPRR
jgi:hypothetical protein